MKVHVVDGQLHEPAPWLAWNDADAETRRDVLTETLFASMDAVGVDSALLFPVEDHTWAEELSRREPHRFGWVPMVMGGDPAGHGRHAIQPDAPDLEEQIE